LKEVPTYRGGVPVLSFTWSSSQCRLVIEGRFFLGNQVSRNFSYTLLVFTVMLNAFYEILSLLLCQWLHNSGNISAKESENSLNKNLRL
jgi:hypothetical protein